MTRAAGREGNAMQVKVKKELFALFSKKEESIRIDFTSAQQAQVNAVIALLPLQQRLAVMCVSLHVLVCVCMC